MWTSINITTSDQDLDRFLDRNHLKHFYKDIGIDGMEVMPVGDTEIPEKIPAEDINGIHLSFLPYWYDFWRGNKENLLQIFGEESVWESFYGSLDPAVLVERLAAELDMAEAVHAKYVVFHISESSPDDCLTYKMAHSDEEVCDAAAEIINQVLERKQYSFEFLCENLWWSGLTIVRPEITKRLMDAIFYEKKGIMLDTGHLLHTNRKLRTQKEAVAYIHEILDKNGELCRYIMGIHLQQSLTGEYVEEFLKNPPDLQMSYYEKCMLVYPHIFQIDIHRPFTDAGVPALIRRISPHYLTYELITENNEVHLERLKEQLDAIEKNGGL